MISQGEYNRMIRKKKIIRLFFLRTKPPYSDHQGTANPSTACPYAPRPNENSHARASTPYPRAMHAHSPCGSACTLTPPCAHTRTHTGPRSRPRPRESIYGRIGPKKGTVRIFVLQCGAREPKKRLVFADFLLISFTFLYH